MLLSLYGLVWQQGAATASPAGVSAAISVGQATAEGLNIFFGGGGGSGSKVLPQFKWRTPEPIRRRSVPAVAVPLPLAAVCILGQVKASGVQTPKISRPRRKKPRPAVAIAFSASVTCSAWPAVAVGAANAIACEIMLEMALGSAPAKGIRNPTDDELLLILMAA